MLTEERLNKITEKINDMIMLKPLVGLEGVKDMIKREIYLDNEQDNYQVGICVYEYFDDNTCKITGTRDAGIVIKDVNRNRIIYRYMVNEFGGCFEDMFKIKY